MEYELNPEPPPVEREALEDALGELLEPETHPAYASRWRALAIRENTGFVPLRDRALTE